MFKRRYIFGVLFAAVAAVGISACNNGGSSSNNGNPCGNPYNYNNVNNGYNNNGIYNNGGCNGNRAIVVGANNNNNTLATQQNAQQAVQQAQLREAIAEADATRLSEDNRRLKKHHRSDDDDDDDSSSGSSHSSTDTVTVSAGPTVRVVPSTGTIITVPAATVQASAPAATTPVVQQAAQPQVAQPAQQATATNPTGSLQMVSTTPGSANSGQPAATYVNSQPTGSSVLGQQQAPPAATAAPAVTAPADQGPVSTPVDGAGSGSQAGTTPPPSAPTTGGGAAVGSSTPAAPQPQQQPVGSSLGPAQAQILTVYEVHEDNLGIDNAGMSAYQSIRSLVQITPYISAKTLGVMPIDPYDYETRLSQSTPLQLPSVKINGKTYTYYTEYTPYIPASETGCDASKPPSDPVNQSLYCIVHDQRKCDIETANPNASACIVLERDNRDNRTVDRAYVLGGFRHSKDRPASATNYQVVRAELPQSVAPAVHMLLSDTQQGIILIETSPTPH